MNFIDSVDLFGEFCHLNNVKSEIFWSMNMGYRTHFEVRNLCVYVVLFCFVFFPCIYVSVFFSLLETQKPKTPVSCQDWWRGGEEQAEIPGVPASSSGSRARQVMKPAGCNTVGIGGGWPGWRSPPFKAFHLDWHWWSVVLLSVENDHPLCGEKMCHPAHCLCFSVGPPST